MERRRRNAGRITGVVAIILGGVAAAWAYGPGYLGYDAAWSLVWGHQLADGQLPSYGDSMAPTPHPLANLVAAFASPLADGGAGALIALTFASFSALVVGVGVLATRLAAWPAGVIAGLVVATQSLLVREAAFASIDLPFLACVVWAAAITVRRPHAGYGPSWLLLAAGLLRPEAWLLAAAYVAWSARRRPRPERVRLVLIAAGAPLLWLASDLVITGNPLYSMSGTRRLADDLERPQGIDAAVAVIGDFLAQPTVIAGGVGMIALLVLARTRIALVAAIAGLGFAGLAVIGVTGLPVLTRYLVLPGVMLAVAAGAAICGPTWSPPGWSRMAAIAVAIVVAALLVSDIRATATDLDRSAAFSRARQRVDAELRAVVSSRPFRVATQRCPTVLVPSFRARPVVVLAVPQAAGRVAVGNLADGERGLLVTYARPATETIFDLGTAAEARMQAGPAGAAEIARTPHWVAYAACRTRDGAAARD